MSSKNINKDNKDDDDDDDYMSDKYLIDNNSSKKTTLLFSHKQKYEHERYKRSIECRPKSKQALKILEENTRQQAMSKPLLDPDNKGFCLLQKMMIKNNDQTSSNGKTVEQLVMERRPIEIELRVGRKGLGHNEKQQIKRNLNEDEMKRKKLKLEQEQQNFLRYNQDKNEQQLIRKDYFNLQKICYNLDNNDNDGGNRPIEEWYWPKEFLNNDSDDSSDEDVEIDYPERLKQLDNYLRHKYNYCIWCGCRYNSMNDLNENCPGNQRQLH